MNIKTTASILFTVIVISLFVYGIYWLWQRQPKVTRQETTTVQNNQIQNPASENNKSQSNFKPQDFSVLTSAKTNFSGKVAPNSIIIIYSNSYQSSTKSDAQGNFQKEVTVSPGLNIFNISVFSQNLDKTDNQTITLYLVKEKEVVGNTVYSGNVKAIFNNLITLGTPNGDKFVNVQKSTDFTFPKVVNSKPESTTSAITNVRVGDYLVALGNTDEKDKITAQKITVIRENKPQNTEVENVIKLLTASRLNLFSAKNEKDSKILEFTLKRDSIIELGGQTAKSTDIVKDKRAIVISYYSNTDQLVDLIYLLP